MGGGLRARFSAPLLDFGFEELDEADVEGEEAKEVFILIYCQVLTRKFD